MVACCHCFEVEEALNRRAAESQEFGEIEGRVVQPPKVLGHRGAAGG